MITLAVILKFVFIVTAMMYVGVSTTVDQARAVLRDRTVMAKALVANLVLVPILGLALVLALPLSPDTVLAVLLLAVAPGGISAIQFSSKIKGQIATASVVLFVLTIVSLVTAPVAAIAMNMRTAGPPIPYLLLVGLMLVCLVGPIVAGATIARTWPTRAQALANPLNLVSTIAFIGAVLASMSLKQPALGQLGWAGIVAIAILILGSMTIGWAVGGPGTGLSQVLASTTSNRNAPICLLIATVGFAARDVDVAILVFLVLVVPPNLVFTIYHLVKAKRHGP